MPPASDDTTQAKDVRPPVAPAHEAQASERSRDAVVEVHRQLLASWRDLAVRNAEFSRCAAALENLYNATTFQLAQAAQEALSGWRGLLRFPGECLRIARETAGRRRYRSVSPLGVALAALDAQAFDPEPLAAEALRLHGGRAAPAAATLARQARLLALLERRPAAIALAERAFQLSPTPAILARCLTAMRVAEAIAAPEALVDALEARGLRPEPRSRPMVERVRARGRLLRQDIALPPRAAPSPSAQAGTVAYILYSSLPQAPAGYAIRSHLLSRALLRGGWSMRPITRPGFPPAGQGSRRPTDIVDDLEYRRISAGADTDLTDLDRIERDARLYAAEIERAGAALVHAASDYRAGLPAMMAARRLGLPFVYEVRGFWELTRASRDPAYAASDRFRLDSGMEAFVAREADAVITLGEAMRQELGRRGVDVTKISLAPNGVDPPPADALAPDPVLRAGLGLPDGVPVIGFVGTVLAYEGLELLLQATAMLAADSPLRVLIVGGGRDLEATRTLAALLGLADRVVFTGPVPQPDVARHYALMDVAVFPRLPLPVTEIVAPVKHLEAMGMARCTVVSSVAALCELVEDGRTGRVVPKGNAPALAALLAELLADPAERERLGRNARQAVLEHLTWDRTAAAVGNVYRGLGSRPN